MGCGASTASPSTDAGAEKPAPKPATCAETEKPATKPAAALDREALLRSIFADIDANGNGSIEVGEFKKLAGSESEQALSMQEAIFGLADANTDGKLNIDEFVKFNLDTGAAVDDDVFKEQAEQWRTLAKAAKAPAAAAVDHTPLLKKVFAAMDADGDGTISIKEFLATAKSADETAELSMLHSMIDGDGNGVLTYEEWASGILAIGSTDAALQKEMNDVLQVLEGAKMSAQSATPAVTTLEISGMAAFGVPDADLRRGSGKSDPYLKFTVLADGPEYDGQGPFGGKGGPTAQTEAVANETNPAWEGKVLSIPLPPGWAGEGELRVRLWDDDVTKEDDAIGSAVVKIDTSGGGAPVAVEKVTLKGREQEGAGGYVLPDFEVSFTYTAK